MRDLWDVTDAFDAMFCDTVEMCGVRPGGRSFRLLLRACVYPPQKEQPFSDTDADTAVEVLPLMVLKTGVDGWTLRSPPQIGDGIRLKCGSRWKVSSVTESDGWYQLEARSC